MCQILSMCHRGRFYTANEMFLDYVELRQSNFAVKNEQVLRIRQKNAEIEVNTIVEMEKRIEVRNGKEVIIVLREQVFG